MGKQQKLEIVAIGNPSIFINNTTSKRMKELETKLEDLNRKLILEKSKVSVQLTESDIRQFFIQALKLEPKLMISSLVKEILLFDDKVEIHFNSPILKDPDISQGLLIYTEFRKMPYVIANATPRSLKTFQINIYI